MSLSFEEYFIIIYFLKVLVILPNGQIFTDCPKPTEWTHIVMNYIEPNDGEGIRMFVNGTEVASDTDTIEWSSSAGDGRIVVGRQITNVDFNYASFQVDELLYFNAALTSDDVQLIYNSP